MFTIRRFIDSLSTRSASMLLAVVCIGLLIGCSGDVGSPEFHISGSAFKINNQNFTAEKTITTEIPVESHVSVSIAAINGEVMVTGHHDVDIVLVTAHLIVGSDSQADADRHLEDLEIQVTDSAEGISIQAVQPQNTDGRQYHVAYDIIVPSDFAMITTQVNGSIDIDDIENSVEALNINGDILLSNIVGGIVADVVNGAIAATVRLPAHATINLITDNGSIELRIPRSTSAAFGASVGNGAINTSNIEFNDVVQTNQSLTGRLGTHGNGLRLERIMKKKLPIFTTHDDRAKYLAAYEAMFALWKVPYDSIDVKTRFGSTHINACGPKGGQPLVLLHGAGLSSTAWYANIPGLSADHRVYAVDVIGDAGAFLRRVVNAEYGPGLSG